MKSVFLVSILIFFGSLGYNQNLSPNLISNGGDDYSFTGGSWSWSLGEVSTESVYGTGLFLTQGFQQSWNMPTVQSQIIDLPLGWSMFSTYMDPDNPALEALMAPVVADIILMKDGDGNVYWPQYSLNIIDSITDGKGYLIKMAQNRQLEISGEVLDPTTTPVQLPANWSMMGYLRQTPGAIESMLSPIAAYVILVKNDAGLVYWPQFSLNFIGNLLPGKGYLIRTSSAVSFYYPANSFNFEKSYPLLKQTQHFPQGVHSDNNMTLAIPDNAWEKTPDPGDEIAVVNSEGKISGASVYTGGTTVITVWGDDPYTLQNENMKPGEKLAFILWNKQSNNEQTLHIENWEEGTGFYEKNGIAIASGAGILPDALATSGIQCRNYPNPFSEQTTFEFYLPEQTRVKLEIVDVLGQSLVILCNERYEAGLHRINWNASAMPAGTYIYRLSTPDESLGHYINLVK